jgi:hypothetical protein
MCVCACSIRVCCTPAVSAEDAATAFADREKMRLLDRALEIRHVLFVDDVLSIFFCLPFLYSGDESHACADLSHFQALVVLVAPDGLNCDLAIQS